MNNPQTAFKQCSHGGKEWHICLGDFTPYWYCPTVLDFNSSHVERIAPCFRCPDSSDCETTVRDVLRAHNISEEATYNDFGLSTVIDTMYGGVLVHRIFDALLLMCQALCEAGTKGDACWSHRFPLHDSCTVGASFCDFASDDDAAMNISGTCKTCPIDQADCYQDGFVASSEGRRNCANCKLLCSAEAKSRLTVNGNEIPNFPIPIAVQKEYQNVSGPLIDCSNLLLENADVCPGAGEHICTLDYGILEGSEVRKPEWQVSTSAEENGCLAVVSNDDFIAHSFDELAVPFVRVDKEDGKKWIKNEQSFVAQVEMQVFGNVCTFNLNKCNGKLPCGKSEYCYYHDVVVDGEYTEGTCFACPKFDNGEPNPAGCFFDQAQLADDTFSLSAPESVESCAKACNARLVSDDCKFCPSEVSALDFGVEDEADQCYFCPNDDVQYLDKVIPLFGENVTCWMVQTFFKRMEVHKDSSNCRLVQSENYMCGCQGTGYAGASTHTKQVLLAWLPRVAAMLSIAGSLFIIFDTSRTRRKRAKLMNQLLSALSFFDVLGSSSYALTTLPTQASDQLYGAKGNDQTCTVQGFFIQIGTIACFLNVSLAVYYLLTIKYGWNEGKMKRKRAAYFLFTPPIVVGLVYAFVGISYYDNVRLWCNNSAKWWSEVPVILAIIAATGIMGNLSHHVYKNEKRTSVYTHSGCRLSIKVFKQSFWFVIAFYITWAPYLAVQYMLSSGRGYDNYGLILSAAILVPLQGFWNFFVYIRTRYLNQAVARVSFSISLVSSLFRRSSNRTTEQSWQLSAAHEQLQVVYVNDNAVVGTIDNEDNNTKTPRKAELDGRAFKTTSEENLHPKLEETCGAGHNDCPHEYRKHSNPERENLDSEEPLRESTEYISKFHQEMASSACSKETIDVDPGNKTTSIEVGTASFCRGLTHGDRQQSLRNFIGSFDK